MYSSRVGRLEEVRPARGNGHGKPFFFVFFFARTHTSTHANTHQVSLPSRSGQGVSSYRKKEKQRKKERKKGSERRGEERRGEDGIDTDADGGGGGGS